MINQEDKLLNRSEIIKLARDCGINFHQAGWPELERFATLVSAAEREAKEELLAALQDLLMDTQHAEHECGDKNCPVARATEVALKYDAICARGQG